MAREPLTTVFEFKSEAFDGKPPGFRKYAKDTRPPKFGCVDDYYGQKDDKNYGTHAGKKIAGKKRTGK